ncbi:hypothetical protein B9Z19DRAFT_1138071 [Tuber borchii]|uniref:Uncharacterized protein n=1 Tax=Tuber borchii TaxID=42251 RepID=A0A2T6Z9Z1_TUBBO|nr:hypothetical protein B9Z19DRAFT_1138071 [Tuber borchii]
MSLGGKALATGLCRSSFGLTFNDGSDMGEILLAFAAFFESMMSRAEKPSVRHSCMYVPTPSTFITTLIPHSSKHMAPLSYDESVLEAYGEEITTPSAAQKEQSLMGIFDTLLQQTGGWLKRGTVGNNACT